MTSSIGMWVGFLSFVIFLLVLDLGVFHRQDHVMSIKESLWLTAFYIAMAFVFGGWIWFKLGFTAFAEYSTGFLIEKSLALDNIFVISVIFSSLAIPPQYQHRVLFWGILGVIILRGLLIALGVQLITHFSGVLYLFALLMIGMGIYLFFAKHTNKVDVENNAALKFIRSHLRVTPGLQGHSFIVRQHDETTGRRHWAATPLLVALIFIEVVDLIFAIDSVPAIFMITTDPFIIYTSNIFAILGLRALYFALEALMGRFTYLKYALAFILIFIGAKVFIADWLDIEKIPAGFSLLVTTLSLGVGIGYSLYRGKKEHSHPPIA